jgi:hypothetical protein
MKKIEKRTFLFLTLFFFFSFLTRTDLLANGGNQ